MEAHAPERLEIVKKDIEDLYKQGFGETPTDLLERSVETFDKTLSDFSTIQAALPDTKHPQNIVTLISLTEKLRSLASDELQARNHKKNMHDQFSEKLPEHLNTEQILNPA